MGAQNRDKAKAPAGFGSHPGKSTVGTMWLATCFVIVLAYVLWMIATDHFKSSRRQVPWRPVFVHLVSRVDELFWTLLGVERDWHFTMPLEDYRDHMTKGCCWAFQPHFILLPSFFLGLKAEKLGIPQRIGIDPQEILGGAASSLFYIPLFRDIILTLGGRVASPEMLASLRLFGIAPGGVHEMLHQVPGSDTCFLRTGFLRLAVQKQVPVIPCYLWGETLTYRPMKPPAALARFQRLLHKGLGIGLPIWTGRWGIPLNPLPYPGKYLVAVGRPLHPPEGKSEDEAVASLLHDYEQEQRRLFNEMQAVQPRPDHQLIFERLTSRRAPSKKAD